MNSNKEREPFYQSLIDRSTLAVDFGNLEGHCMYIHFNVDSVEHIPTKEFTFDGCAFFLLERGEINVRHNQINYVLTGPSIMVFSPGSTISLGAISSISAEIHILYCSRSFLSDLNLSLGVFTGDEFIEKPRPEITLDEKELSMELRYCKIIRNVMADKFNDTINAHILNSIVTALIYQNMLFVFKQMGANVSERVPNRRSTYVREFLKLVHLNYTKERSVIYYANKLCVSPKYLSILVKESTGRSAAAWIDHFVIIEAKNLLRFSGKNVQQVAYALNFVNQSAFGKYFKHITGMSPTEYQRKN